jgi:hypothetical protein
MAKVQLRQDAAQPPACATQAMSYNSRVTASRTGLSAQACGHVLSAAQFHEQHNTAPSKHELAPHPNMQHDQASETVQESAKHAPARSYRMDSLTSHGSSHPRFGFKTRTLLPCGMPQPVLYAGALRKANINHMLLCTNMQPCQKGPL